MNKRYEQSVVWWIVLIATCVALWLSDHPQAFANIVKFLESL